MSVAVSTDRRAREKAALRSRILEAARALFAKHGYEAVTMRELAARIGYTATALYYHFPDKESLLRELCETDFSALRNSFKRLGRVADPVERIRATGHAYVNFGLEHPQQYRLMFMTTHPKETAGKGELGRSDQDAYAFLLRTVQEALDAGRFRADLKDPELIAQALWAGMHGLVALHLNRSETDWLDWRPPRRTAAVLAESLLRGLLRNSS